MNIIKKYGKELVIIFVFLLIGIGIGALCLKNYFDNKNDIKIEEKVDEKPNIKEDTLDEDNDISPLLYKVTKDGSDTTMYLFGSIHVADDRAYPLPNEVINAYDSSDYLAVEFDLVSYSSDYKAQVESLKTLVLTDGTTVKDHLSKETYDLMVEYLKDNNMYSSAYDYYKPAIHYSLISNIQTELSDLDSNKGIDMYFLEKAHKENKDILEVETAESQYSMLSSLPDELFDYLILSSIKYEKTMVNQTIELYEAWLSGDAQYVENSVSSDDYELLKKFDAYENLIGLIESYNKALIYDRNKTMTDTAVQYFESGKNVFFVVGLAHIVGEDAIAENLEKAGYNIELIKYEQ